MPNIPPRINEQGEPEIPTWWVCGDMMVNREGLDPEHLHSFHNELRALGLDPYKYDVPHPSRESTCPHCGQPCPYEVAMKETRREW